MSPRGRRAAWLVLGLAVAVFVLAALTPAPLWVGLHAASWLAPRTSWQVSAQRYEGSVARGFTLVGLAARTQDSSVVLTVERAEVQLLAYDLTLVRPQVRVRRTPPPVAEEKPAGPPTQIPVGRIPSVTVHGGGLVLLQPDGTVQLAVDSLDARYRAQGDTTGRLEAQAAQVLVPRAGQEPRRGTLGLAVRVAPSRVNVDSVSLATRADTLALLLVGSGELLLLRGLPSAVQLDAEVQSPGGALGGHAELTLRGQLQPLDLRGRIGLEGRHPATGRVALRAQVAVDSQRVVLDSLAGDILSGTLDGRLAYYLTADSLEGTASLRAVQWSVLTPAVHAGPAAAHLRLASAPAAGRYDVDLEVEQSALEVMPGRVFDVLLTASHRPDGATAAHLRAPVMELSAEGRAVLDSLPGPASYDLRLAGELRPELLVEGLRSPVDPVRIAGRLRPDSAHVELVTAHPPVAGLQDFGRLTAQLDLAGSGQLEAHVSLEEELLRAALLLDLETGRLDTLHARLGDLALERLDPQLHGHVRGEVGAHGALRRDGLRAGGQLTVEHGGYRDWDVEPLALRLTYAAGGGQAWLDGDHLHAEAGLDPAGALRGQAAFSGPLLYRRAAAADRGAQASEPAAPDSQALGMVGALAWQLDLERPQMAAAQLDLDTLWARHEGWWARTSAPVHARYARGGVDLGSVDLQTPVGALRLEGTARPDSLALAMKLDPLNLAAIVPDVELRGRAGLVVQGTAQRPEAHGTVEMRDVRLDTLLLGDLAARLDLQDTLQLGMALSQWQQEAARIVLRASAAPLLAGVGASSPGAAHLEFVLPHLDLTAPLTYAAGRPTQGWLAAEGGFDVPLARLDSTLSWRDLRGSLVFRGLHAAGLVGQDSVHVDMTPGWRVSAEDSLLDIQEVRVQAERYDRDRQLFVPAGSLVAGGRLENGVPSRLQVNLQGLDLVTFGLPEGTAAAEVRVAGTVEHPELEADLEVSTEDLGAVTGHVQGGARGAQFRAAWTTLLQDSLVVDGEVPWNWGEGTIDSAGVWARVRSPGFGLSIFADQLADLDQLGGRLVSDLEIRGLGDGMRLDGYVDVAHLQVGLLDTEPVYRFPRGRIDFRGRRAELSEFVSPATRDNGRMELTGFIDLASLQDPGFRLRLVTDHLQYRYEEIFNAKRVDLDLTLDGSLSHSRVSGQVSVRDALAEPVLVTLNAPPVPPPPPALQDPFLESMGLDVTVDIGDLSVDSELAKAKAEGAAQIGGTFYKPQFQGDVEILEGKVYLLNREFDLERGRIVLNNIEPTRSLLQVAYDPLELNPDLDLVATTKVVPTDDEERTEHKVTLTVGGTALNPQPEFTCDPALDFYSILRLLAFGTLGTQQGGTSEYTQALGTAAGQLLSKHVEAAGLDEFVVLPSGTFLEAVGQPSLRLGKYFHGPVPFWVHYEAPVRFLSTGEVRLERRLLPYLTLTGSAQSAYDRYGMGLSLKKEF